MMKRILICGAAGFTNRGDDALLWGMLSQLRAHRISVIGGPELATLTRPFGATALTYEDRAEVARAVEDADLVILGGGGLLYDHDYDPSLARFLTDPPDRQWLYETAKLVSAARAAGKPVMIYGMGVGPLMTESGRRVARYLGESVQAFTVRDQASADLLAACGLAGTRVQVAADPAVLVEPGSEEAAESFVEAAGLSARPRPWIGLNLRPWYQFMGVETEPGSKERFLAAAAGLVTELRTRLGGTLVLLPFQRLYDNDAEVLGRVLEATGQSEGAVLVEPPTRPEELVAVLGRLDLMVGMRMHSCLLALNAGVPFVSLAYSPKAQEFARLAGMAEYAQSLDTLDPFAAAAACEKLLSEREAAQARIVQARGRLREAAEVSADLAVCLLESKRETPRPVGRRKVSPEKNLHVLMQIRPDFREKPGGDVIQLEAIRPYLQEMGVITELTGEEAPDLSGYDLVHTINLDLPEDPYRHCLHAHAQGKPIALSTVHTDMREFLEWGDTDYWRLPEPGEGLPESQPAPPSDPVELRRRAREQVQRQLLIDGSDSYLPNAQVDAAYLQHGFGLDLSRTVVVPNGVREAFFEARPDLFIEKYGLRDFVLCVGRVEKKKNQLSLIAALRGSGLPLVIVGRGNPPEYMELCRRYADKNVHFLEGLSEEELISACAAAQVHALVSWMELPGLTTLEAVAAGCNVVSTDRGSPSEYLQDMAWYIDPRRPESIREAVLAAYHAPKSDRLRAHIRERFSWRKAAEATCEGYRVALEVYAGRSGEEQRQVDLEARRRHYVWLERLAADRLYELQRARKQQLEVKDYVHDLKQRGDNLEELLTQCREEIDKIAARRSYRVANALACLGWGILRRLGAKR